MRSNVDNNTASCYRDLTTEFVAGMVAASLQHATMLRDAARSQHRCQSSRWHASTVWSLALQYHSTIERHRVYLLHLKKIRSDLALVLLNNEASGGAASPVVLYCFKKQSATVLGLLHMCARCGTNHHHHCSSCQHHHYYSGLSKPV